MNHPVVVHIIYSPEATASPIPAEGEANGFSMEVAELTAVALLLSRPPLSPPLPTSSPFMATAVTCSLVDVMPRYKNSLLFFTTVVVGDHQIR